LNQSTHYSVTNSRKTTAERLHRVVQRQAPAGAVERLVVHLARGGAGLPGGLEKGV